MTVPWQKNRNRPYWVADETLNTEPATIKATNDTAGLIVMLVFAMFAVSTGFVAAGNKARTLEFLIGEATATGCEK